MALQGYLTRQDPKTESLLHLFQQMLSSRLGQISVLEIMVYLHFSPVVSIIKKNLIIVIAVTCLSVTTHHVRSTQVVSQ